MCCPHDPSRMATWPGLIKVSREDQPAQACARDLAATFDRVMRDAPAKTAETRKALNGTASLVDPQTEYASTRAAAQQPLMYSAPPPAGNLPSSPVCYGTLSGGPLSASRSTSSMYQLGGSPGGGGSGGSGGSRRSHGGLETASARPPSAGRCSSSSTPSSQPPSRISSLHASAAHHGVEPLTTIAPSCRVPDTALPQVNSLSPTSACDTLASSPRTAHRASPADGTSVVPMVAPRHAATMNGVNGCITPDPVHDPVHQPVRDAASCPSSVPCRGSLPLSMSDAASRTRPRAAVSTGDGAVLLSRVNRAACYGTEGIEADTEEAMNSTPRGHEMLAPQSLSSTTPNARRSGGARAPSTRASSNGSSHARLPGSRSTPPGLPRSCPRTGSCRTARASACRSDRTDLPAGCSSLRSNHAEHAASWTTSLRRHGRETAATKNGDSWASNSPHELV